MMMDEILTVPEIAEYLRVSRTTVWRWCNEGKLRAFKAGRHWRVPRSEIEKMVGFSLDDGAEAGTEDGRRRA